jgi:CrcB protein
MTALVVAFGAAVGAPTRYLADRLVQSRYDSRFPLGTLSVNVVGSLLLGMLVGVPAPPHVLALVGVGFCGALTTYSAFGFGTVRLLQRGSLFVAAANVMVSIVAGLGAALLGVAVARSLL